MRNVEVAKLMISWPYTYINGMYSARDAIHQLMHAQGTIIVAFDPRVIKSRGQTENTNTTKINSN